MNQKHTVLISLAALALSAGADAQSRLSLAYDQTPIRNQGRRNTCVTFSAIAALEAAYHRAGYGRVDLSEEFENYVGKMFWLDLDWSNVRTAATTENQVGAFGGGSGTGHMRWLASGMRVPTEADMPYRPNGYGALRNWTDPFWDVQKNVNDFNLDRRNLPRRALTADRYYRGNGFLMLQSANSASEIEASLRRRREVVWDFQVRGNRSGSIWRPDSSVSRGAHSMLIIGYDKTDPNPQNHYFIAKNSWGPTQNPGGYTHISYSYLQYGYSAGCFIGVHAPSPWRSAAMVGRYNMAFDGHRGTLDVTHVPGVAQMWLNEAGVTIADRRVGTFFDGSGVAHRVNGRIIDGKLWFCFKGSYRNMRYDDQRESGTGVGRGFNYELVNDEKGEFAGWHQDNAGQLPLPPWGGYARQPSTIHGTDGYLNPVFSNSTPRDPLQYVGTWTVQFANRPAHLTLERRDDSIVPAHLRGTWAGLRGSIFVDGSLMNVTAMAKIADARYLQLEFSLPLRGGLVTTDCYMLSRQRGVFAGAATVDGVTEGIYGYRIGGYQAGRFTNFGQGCGRNTPIVQSVIGQPRIGYSIRYGLRGSGNLPGVFNIGYSNTRLASGARLPLDLTALGAPGCFLLTEPVLVLPNTTNTFGHASATIQVTDANLIGTTFHSQFIQLDPQANSLGATFSNGYTTRLGS